MDNIMADLHDVSFFPQPGDDLLIGIVDDNEVWAEVDESESPLFMGYINGEEVWAEL